MIHKIFCVFLLTATSVVAADYEILEKSDTITIQTGNFATEQHSETVRILTDRGTGYQKVLTVNSYIKIKNISGVITHADGKTETLDRENIVEMPVSESADMITDLKALVIAPSSLRVGSRFELSYERNVTSLLYLDPWIYNSFVPLKKAVCKVLYPANIPVKYRGEDDRVKIQKSETGGQVTLILETSDRKAISLLGQQEETYEVQKKVQFLPEQCMTEKWLLSTASWQSIAAWFLELSKFAFQTDAAMDQVVQDVLQRFQKPEEIADALYQYIQKNYSYTAIEIGIGGYKPRFATQTFQKKYGDCKDLTFLYLALLRKAGIEAYPALVDTRPARFFYKNFPSPLQFNHCIAYLPKIKNGTWVDSTVKNFRLGEIPSVLQGKYALVAGGPNDLLPIPENFAESNIFHMKAAGELKGNEIHVQGIIETSGMASMLVDVMQNALARGYVRNYVYSKMLLPEIPVQKLQTTIESARVLRVDFSTPANALQDYRIVLINPLHYPAMKVIGVEVESEQYYSLGDPVRYILESTIDLKGHRLVSNAQDVEKKGKYVAYSLRIKEEEGKLKYRADTYFANGLLGEGEIRELQKELEEFSSVLVRSILLKASTGP